MNRRHAFLTIFGVLVIPAFFYLGAVAQTISRAEYFFDTDPGVGNGTPLTIPSPADVVTFATSVSIAGLDPGYHIMFVRTWSSDGKWSLYEPKEFIIEAPITKGEYFVDTDPGIGNGIPLAFPAGQLTITPSISLVGLPDGEHFLFVRTKNGKGRWSLSEPIAFYIRARIVQAEYFFDTDPGVGHATPLNVTSPSDLVNITATVAVGALADGTHYLFARTRDILGRWSMYEPQTFTVDNALPIELLSFQAQATENGDVRLTWTTASEYENDYFIVMHSVKGREFEEIGRIDAAGTSRILLKYSYTHRRPVAGLNYYRLAQVDFDGTQKLSDVVVANVALGEEPSIYPNPATDTWQVDLGGLHGFGTTIELLDLRGAPFLKLETNDERDVTLARKGIANGVYIVRITSPGATHMMKIVFR